MQGTNDTPERPTLVTEVRVQLTREPPILAFISITLRNALVVHDLRILERRDGSRVVLMPRARGTDGTWTTVAHPVNEATRREIERAILAAYEKCQAEQAGKQALG
ncbi:MAG: SpoVG family protein [Candidatus Eisenbacteria bacterium]|nr:septation protein SpoVG family protein [Candidatus Eisenbacteria bacterium]MCC7144201.1 SpoVG family protein [Candidatus Eisenbacteria bacterium]